VGGTVSEFDRHGAIVIATLNRPDERNAISDRSHVAEVEAFCAEHAADDSVKAVVLTGAGAANPGSAMRMAKRLLGEGQDMKLGRLLELPAAYQALAHHTDDHEQAVQETGPSAREFMSGLLSGDGP
jgi:1,4-dihydroxy-2-naphthoyl-CoA synthase